jgi:hypothetical protein
MPGAMMTTARLMLITILTTLAYLGLAVLGWGGFAAFFSHPSLIALAITLLVLSGVAAFSGGNLSPGVREDRANRWVIAAFGLIGLLAAYLPAYTDRKGFWTLDRVGGHPARAYAGHEGCLWHHSPPELSRVARQLSGLGARLSFGGRGASHSASYTAARRAHTCVREAAALAVRRRVRGLSKPHSRLVPGLF